MQKYGHTLLLDATHKTTKYALPVFFLAVKTNVDYQVVLPLHVANINSHPRQPAYLTFL
jgi:hypothetical protein